MSSGSAPLRVFTDTNALLSMIVFPVDREGRPTLAGEVKALYESGAFDLVVSWVVAEELLAVVDERFPDERGMAEQFLRPFEQAFTRWPTWEEVQSALPYTVDREDAPVFAAAALSRPDVVLSNDFETFHTEQAKAFWEQYSLRVESLYGLLCVFGKRQRKEGAEAA